MTPIDRTQLQHIMDEEEPILIEVLDEKHFRKFHLPKAINVPLSDNFDEEIQRAVPDKSESILVYCMDENCNASPKAAQRMKELGY